MCVRHACCCVSSTLAVSRPTARVRTCRSAAAPSWIQTQTAHRCLTQPNIGSICCAHLQALIQFGKDVVEGTAKKFFKSGAARLPSCLSSCFSSAQHCMRACVPVLICCCCCCWPPEGSGCVCWQSLLRQRRCPLACWWLAPAHQPACAHPLLPSAADVPKEPLDKGVAVIVGNTVESIVKDPTKASAALGACNLRVVAVCVVQWPLLWGDCCEGPHQGEWRSLCATCGKQAPIAKAGVRMRPSKSLDTRSC